MYVFMCMCMCMSMFTSLFADRVAEMSEEGRRIRPPRYLHADGIVRPFNYREAEGNEIMAVSQSNVVASVISCVLLARTCLITRWSTSPGSFIFVSLQIKIILTLDMYNILIH